METNKEKTISFLMLTVGATLAAFAMEEFLVPNSIFDGGVAGVAMISEHYLPIPLGVLVALMNLPFLIVAYKQLGHSFVIKAGYSMLLFSVLLVVFRNMADATDDLLLATTFGGALLGVGVGLVLRGGGCLDGTEIVGILVSRRSDLSIGKIVLIINIVIYTVAGALFGIDRGLYSILMYFITSKVIDFVELDWDETKAVMIITDQGKIVADAIYANLGRTVTFMKGEGFVSNSEKDIIYCVITRAEIYEMRKLIHSLDIDAFTTITDVSEIIGNHLKKTD
ncbi:MAG: YitT family protein [Lachnospiraceae bacterium]|nr:YitT family protein [Lachnospiraceae bacterium]